MTRDILVIGGGVIGLSAAHECARRGASVTLLASGAPGASSAAAGMLCPAFERIQTGGVQLAEMGAASLDMWDDFAAILAPGGDPHGELGYARTGTIGVGYPEGVLPGDRVDVPSGIEAPGAVLVEGEGQVDPRRLLPALRAACAREGVTFVRGEASDLVVADDCVRGAKLAEGGTLSAGRTILATGASALGGRLRRIRGRAFLVRDLLGLDRVVRSPSVYLAPKAGGTLYVGATEEEEGASRDGPGAADGLWSEACWLAPALREAEVLERFDGVRPCAPNELPIIGPDPDRERLTLALGHHRNGVLLAPLTAKIAADAALGG